MRLSPGEFSAPWYITAAVLTMAVIRPVISIVHQLKIKSNNRKAMSEITAGIRKREGHSVLDDNEPQGDLLRDFSGFKVKIAYRYPSGTVKVSHEQIIRTYGIKSSSETDVLSLQTNPLPGRKQKGIFQVYRIESIEESSGNIVGGTENVKNFLSEISSASRNF